MANIYRWKISCIAMITIEAVQGEGFFLMKRPILKWIRKMNQKLGFYVKCDYLSSICRFLCKCCSVSNAFSS